jgi:4-carboxymuconolactone decarboxylase
MLEKYVEKGEAHHDRQYRTFALDPVRDLDPDLSAILELPCRAVSDSRRTGWSGRCGLQVTLEREKSMAPKQPVSSRALLGEIAPKLFQLTNDVLFGDVWERPGLSKRDRSLITVSSLVALNRTEQLRFHIPRALENGVTKDELVELITHLAFYSGWPTAVSAALVAKEMFAEE